jgi:hypothetical protein
MPDAATDRYALALSSTLDSNSRTLQRLGQMIAQVNGD